MCLYLECNFENYDNANFTNSLNEVVCENENTESYLKDLDYFCKVCTEVLNKMPLARKYVRGNKKQFMNNAISTTIISAKNKS